MSTHWYLHYQCPCPHSEAQPPQETLQDRQVGLAQALMKSQVCPPGSQCAQDFVCALQEWSFCFPQP